MLVVIPLSINSSGITSVLTTGNKQSTQPAPRRECQNKKLQKLVKAERFSSVLPQTYRVFLTYWNYLCMSHLSESKCITKEKRLTASRFQCNKLLRANESGLFITLEMLYSLILNGFTNTRPLRTLLQHICLHASVHRAILESLKSCCSEDDVAKRFTGRNFILKMHSRFPIIQLCWSSWGEGCHLLNACYK